MADSTEIRFNSGYFDSIMKTSKVDAITQAVADRAAGIAKSTAPVDSGDYRNAIRVQERESRFRTVKRVVGGDPKTLLIESKTGNLARALKAAKK